MAKSPYFFWNTSFGWTVIAKKPSEQYPLAPPYHIVVYINICISKQNRYSTSRLQLPVEISDAHIHSQHLLSNFLTFPAHTTGTTRQCANPTTPTALLNFFDDPSLSEGLHGHAPRSAVLSPSLLFPVLSFNHRTPHVGCLVDWLR